MLQTLRDNMKGTVAAFIVAILVIPFVFFGVDSLFMNRGVPGEVAEVNGESITEMQLMQAIAMQRQQILSQYGEQVPAEFYSDERLREPVLQSLVQREVLATLAASAGMGVAPAVADAMITSSNAFQDADGKFDADVFVERLRRIGYTPRTYREAIINDTLISQLSAGVKDTAFITDAELDKLLSLSRQTRDFSYILLPVADVLANVEVSEQEISDYYQANQASFMRAEQVQVNYLDVSGESLKDRVTVDEALVKAQYDQEVADYQAQTERKVQHILIEPKEDGSDQDVIEKVRAGLANGEAFESLAKQYSDDFVSRESGGDLGFFVAGAFPEAFEKAVGELAEGEVSGVVETEAGFHFIKLAEVVTTEIPSFEESKARITETLRKANAANLLADILTRLSELTFNADNLHDAADELGLTVRTSEFFTRDQGNGIAANASVRAAAFSDDILADGHNSQVLELTPDHVVVVRVAEYKPEAVKPLEDVADGIKNQLVAAKAEAILAEQAAAITAQLNAGADIETVAQERGLEWQISVATERSNPGLDRQLLAGVFALPKPSAGSVVDRVELINGDNAVVSLAKVNDGDIRSITAEERKALKQQLLVDHGNTALSAFAQFALDQAEIVIR